MRKGRKIVLVAVLCALALAVTATALFLLGRQKAEIRSGGVQELCVVLDNNYPPYVFYDESGNLQGILVDQWRLWEEKTGVHVKLSAMDWSTALEAMKSGKYDVIDTAFYNEERDEWLDFSEPYVTISVPAFHDNRIGGITDVKSLRGFLVAVKKDDACIEVLKKNGVTDLVEYSSYEAIIDAVRAGKVRVFVMDEPPALYYLYKTGLANRYSGSLSIYSGEFHRAVAQGDAETLQLVEDGFSQITDKEFESIQEKWFGRESAELYFTYFLKYFLLGLGVVAFMILMIMTWNRRLRREVKKKTAELLREKEMLDITLQSIGDGVVATDIAGAITLINQTAQTLTGWGDEAIGKPFSEVLQLVSEETGLSAESPIQKALLTGETVALANHTALVTRMGSRIPVADRAAPIRDEEGHIYGVVMVFRDIAQEKAQRERIDYIVSHDSMTGLYNRYYMEDRIQSLERADDAPFAVIMGDLNGLKLVNDAFGHNAGDIFIIKVAEILRESCREGDLVGRWGGDEFLVLMPGGTADAAEHFIDRVLRRCTEESDERIQLSIAMGYAVKTPGGKDFQEILRQAEQWTYRRKLMIEKSFRNSIINALLSTLSAKSEETEEHAERLQQYCTQVGKILGVSAKELDEMALFAMLHDIGKVGINDGILQKPGPLTDEEWNEMKKHPEIGFRIAQNNLDLAPVAEYILCHHEHWDGSGYPRGMKGEDIPLLSRILTVVDAFDAMTSERVYRKAISREAAAAELLQCAGKQFDPEIVRVFVEQVLKLGS
ncbi:MAG TPA: transporter substrate-binding domain-containing protein [Feifaniaceae bacterium]|nr:transporter substrate-binding domain-containing protein [Feifaniaceae bacterium]